MKASEQYEKFGLEKPITVRAGVLFHLLLWGGGSFLLFGCIWALKEGDIAVQLAGGFGLVFFGLGLGIVVFALLRSWSRGLLEISKEGLYMSHIGVVIPWVDIGPAWLSVTKHAGGKTEDVLYVLRNVSQHSARMGNIGRLLMWISKKAAHSQSGGVVDWGLGAVLGAADAEDDMYDQLSVTLEQMRNSIRHESDATVFNVPVPLRFGIPAKDLVAIINHEVALRNGLLHVKPFPAGGSQVKGSCKADPSLATPLKDAARYLVEAAQSEGKYQDLVKRGMVSSGGTKGGNRRKTQATLILSASLVAVSIFVAKALLSSTAQVPF